MLKELETLKEKRVFKISIESKVSKEFFEKSDKFKDELPLQDYIFILGFCVGLLAKKIAPDKWSVIKCFGDGINNSENEVEG